jgi:hypothetical protein
MYDTVTVSQACLWGSPIKYDSVTVSQTCM